MVARLQDHRLLGTVVDVSVTATSEPDAEEAASYLLDEIRRLERIFNAFDADSELARWRSGGGTSSNGDEPSASFRHLMGRALHWQQLSGGAFNPMVGELTECWRAAEASGVEPSLDQLAAVAEAIAAPRFEISDGDPVAIGDCNLLNLNALAKGYIVDEAVVAVVARFDVASLLVNAGGDLKHHGGRPATVGIENPARPYDNEPPMARVELNNQALATSGGSRRPFIVGGRKYSHLLDPGNGRPCDMAVAATVMAPTAEVADVAATIACIVSPSEAVTFIDQLDGASALIVESTGHRRATSTWGEISH